MQIDFNNVENFSMEDVQGLLEEIAIVLQKMRKIEHIPSDQRAEIISNAKNICIPIANRVGLDELKAELEDTVLKSSFPALYHSVNHLLGSTHEERKQFIYLFKKPLESALRKGDFRFTSRSRIKSVASIADKMGRLGVGIEEIYDVFAIRFVLEVLPSREEEACWQAFTILKKRYEMLPEKFRNWLDDPRPNGYRALHATLRAQKGPWVEVQIRTQKMDEVAERGTAAHWRYKKSNQNDFLTHLEPWLMQVRDIIEQHPYLVEDALIEAEKLINLRSA